MSETRSKSAIYLIGKPLKSFSGKVLPTSLEVLGVYFYYKTEANMSQKDAVKTVVHNISEIWSKARIPISEERNIIRKMDSLLEKYRNICRNKNRKGAAQIARVADFVESLHLLFDVAHHSALSVIKTEEVRHFLMDQRSERKNVMPADINFIENEHKKALKSLQEAERVKKEEIRRRKARETVQWSGSSNEEEDDPTKDPDAKVTINTKISSESAAPSTLKTTHKRRKFTASTLIPGGLASALDRTKMSNREACYVLTEAAKAWGLPEPNKLPLSISSIERSRIDHRFQHARKTRSEFSSGGSLVTHFDGKLLPANKSRSSCRFSLRQRGGKTSRSSESCTRNRREGCTSSCTGNP